MSSTPDVTATRAEASAEAVVRVRLFAALRERAGWAERAVPLRRQELPQTPASLWRQLGLGNVLPAGLRVAINHAFAAPDTPLAPGDEVAFLPPITGG